MFSFKTNGRRVAKALAFAVAGAAIAAPGAQAEKFIPGVTDFPSRPAYVQDDGFVPGVTDFPSRPAYVQQGGFTPGVTDFPSRLGVTAEQAAATRIARAEPSQSPSSAIGGSDFDWGAAGIGAGIGLGAMLLAAVALRTRPRMRLSQ